MPKSAAARQAKRHNPLEADIIGGSGLLKSSNGKRKSLHAEEKEDDHYVNAKQSAKILQLGRELVDTDASPKKTRKVEPETSAFDLDSRQLPTPDEDDEPTPGDGDDEAWGDEDEEVVIEGDDISPGDLKTFNRFLSKDEDPLLQNGWPGGGRPTEGKEEEGTNLADLIMAKIQAFEAAQGPRNGGVPVDDLPEEDLPAKVIEVYEKVGMILSRWRSGPLPKPIKILPTVPNWEQIIEITQPDNWTPNAIYSVTRIFASAKPIVVQRWLEIVVLPRIREDIHETKKLNVHLYNAIKKSVYKPSAFFKGIVFAMISDGTCTLREATIVASVMARVSIPVLHSAAGLKGLCDIAAQKASAGENAACVYVFVKTLLDKGLALPYQVIDALVFFFLRFRSVDPASVRESEAMDRVDGPGVATRLPVLFHQCLLSFAQRYRNDITEDQREALLDLLLTHGHSAIGPEVRRELLAGRGRGVALEPPAQTLDGDDTMMAG